MAPRAYWKGYLKLSLVSCPIALFPATSEREKISFHQLNKETGNRIRYKKVDAETGDEVENADIVKGYEVRKGEYIELEPEELEAVALESKRIIEIDEFVPRSEIDELYMRDPYYIVPDGDVGQQAFAVIREAIRKEGMVALGKVVFTSREHIIALEARGKGMMGITLRYPYEVRKEEDYFDTIEDEKIPKDMIDLAVHIVETKTGHFKPQQFKDEYEDALKDLLRKKQKGEKIERAERARAVERHQSDGRAAAERQSRRQGDEAAAAPAACRRDRAHVPRKRPRAEGPSIRRRADARQAGAIRRRDLATGRPVGPRSDERLPGTGRRSVPRPAQETRQAVEPQRSAAAQRRGLGRRPSITHSGAEARRQKAAIMGELTGRTRTDRPIVQRPNSFLVLPPASAATVAASKPSTPAIWPSGSYSAMS